MHPIPFMLVELVDVAERLAIEAQISSPRSERQANELRDLERRIREVAAALAAREGEEVTVQGRVQDLRVTGALIAAEIDRLLWRGPLPGTTRAASQRTEGD